MRLRNWFGGALAAGLVFGLGGCSKYAPVEGVVLLDDKPLPGATVMFIPLETNAKRGGPRQANALTDKDGWFRLETVNKKGAIPARYKIMVSKKVLPPGVKPPDPNNMAEVMSATAKMVESLPKVYTDQRLTPLEFEVTSKGVKDKEIKLSSDTGKTS